MVMLDRSKGLAMVGDAEEVFGEVLSIVRAYVREAEKHDEKLAEWAKKVIIDQVASNFDESRVDLYFAEGGEHAS